MGRSNGEYLMPLDVPEDIEKQEVPECQGAEEAINRFEKIMLSRIYVQQRLGDRLKNSIRAGMVILFLLAISIFILLLTLSIQVSRVADVVAHMNENFVDISDNMKVINGYMVDMESQVAYLPKIKHKTAVMDQQMNLLNVNFASIKNEMKEMTRHISVVKGEMSEVSQSVRYLDGQVGLMSRDTQRMSRPAKSMNKFFPF